MKKIVIFLCIQFGCSVMAFSQNPACDSLISYLIGGDNAHAKQLIASKTVDIDCFSGDRTPLMIAASRGNLELVKYLLDKGASPHLKSKDGRTALFDAVFIYEQALEPNLSVKPKRKKYNYKIKDKIVKLLINHGANINETDSLQINLLMLACMYNRPEMVQLFVKAGIDVNVQNEYGLSALMYAVQENYNINIIKFLLKSGADTKLQDNQGRTALDFAKEKRIQDVNIIDLLQ